MTLCAACSCALARRHYVAPGTGRERLSNLERAKHELSVFMQRCERVTLLKGDELKAWEDKVRGVQSQEGMESQPLKRGGGHCLRVRVGLWGMI